MVIMESLKATRLTTKVQNPTVLREVARELVKLLGKVFKQKFYKICIHVIPVSQNGYLLRKLEVSNK